MNLLPRNATIFQRQSTAAWAGRNFPKGDPRSVSAALGDYIIQSRMARHWKEWSMWAENGTKYDNVSTFWKTPLTTALLFSPSLTASCIPNNGSDCGGGPLPLAQSPFHHCQDEYSRSIASVKILLVVNTLGCKNQKKNKNTYYIM